MLNELEKRKNNSPKQTDPDSHAWGELAGRLGFRLEMGKACEYKLGASLH